jgi:hypothetical protein
MYRKLGYEVFYATFPFLWNDTDLFYSPKLRQLATSLPVAHHLACRVRIKNRWVLVDATWDLLLKRAGFPVNENWDGEAETLGAVKITSVGPADSVLPHSNKRTVPRPPPRTGTEPMRRGTGPRGCRGPCPVLPWKDLSANNG